MTSKTDHRLFLEEEIIKRLLAAGTIPSAETIVAELDNRFPDYDFTFPSFRAANYKINSGDHSSVSLTEDTFERIYSDLLFLYQYLYQYTLEAASQFDKTAVQLQGLSKKIKDLRSKLQSELLLSNNTEGYFAYHFDTFSDLSKVDQSQTTAFIDLVGQACHAGSEAATSDNLQGKIVLDENYSERHVTFQVISKEGFLTITTNEGDIENILDEGKRGWLDTLLFSTSKNAVTCELRFDLESERSINKIILQPHLGMGGGRLLASIQYSLDGVTWYNVPADPYIRAIVGDNTWIFGTITAKWIKITLSKYGYEYMRSDGSFAYQIGFKHIGFYNTNFIPTETILVSKPLVSRDADDNPQEFRRVALEVCESIPPGTSIDYEIAFGVYSGENIVYQLDTAGATRWIPIDPTNREDALNPTIIEVVTAENLAPKSVNTYNKFTGVAPSFQFSEVDGITILQHALSTETIESKLQVFRNVNSDIGITTPYYITQPNGFIAPRGWLYDGVFYETNAFIPHRSGLDIDLGKSEMIIDGFAQTGKIHLDFGLHKIRTHKQNWIDINQWDAENDRPFLLAEVTNFDKVTTTFTGADAKVFTDPLWPYNHKLLIEGLNYGAAMISQARSQAIYPHNNKTILAAQVCRQTSAIDLIHSGSTNTALDRYAIVEYDGDPSLSNGIMVWENFVLPDIADEDVDSIIDSGKIPSAIYQQEDFLVMEQIPVSEDDANFFDTAEVILLKAKFSAPSSSGSAVLEEYKIKMAD